MYPSSPNPRRKASTSPEGPGAPPNRNPTRGTFPAGCAWATAVRREGRQGPSRSVGDHPYSQLSTCPSILPAVRRTLRLTRGRLARRVEPVVSQAHRPISGIDRPRQILRARTSEISVCRGIASSAPVAGLVHSECERPSRFRWQPCFLRWRSRSPRFTLRRPSPDAP